MARAEIRHWTAEWSWPSNSWQAQSRPTGARSKNDYDAIAAYPER